MKTLLLSVVIAAFSIIASAETEIYLLIGQSNMAGRGSLNSTNQLDLAGVMAMDVFGYLKTAVEPLHCDKKTAGAGLGASFARAMRESNANRTVLLVPCAFGGSRLDEWEKGSYMYEHALLRTRQALKKTQKEGGRLAGILWHQGESDSSNEQLAKTYAARFCEMITNLRTDLGAGNVPLVVGELGRYLAENRAKGGNKSYVYFEVVNDELHKAAKTLPNCACVSSEGLTPNSDILHFDTPSLRVFGARYAEAMRKLAAPKEVTGSFGKPPRGWEGLRVAVLGDSITDPDQTRRSDPAQSQNVYWQYLAAWLKWDVRVYGISGHRWEQIPGQTDRLIREMGDDVDAILIFVGTNDYAHSDPLGDWYETTPSTVNWWGKDRALTHRTFSMTDKTVRGRINLALSKLKKRYPNAQIVILTPIHRAFFQCSPTNIQPAEDWPNLIGLHLEDYVAAVREGAAIWSCPVIDLYGESGLTPILREEYSAFFRSQETDLLHPNSLGHRRLADLIYCRLKALPPTFRR